MFFSGLQNLANQYPQTGMSSAYPQMTRAPQFPQVQRLGGGSMGGGGMMMSPQMTGASGQQQGTSGLFGGITPQQIAQLSQLFQGSGTPQLSMSGLTGTQASGLPMSWSPS